LTAYDSRKYDSLQGYADDVVEIVREFSRGPAVFVGHSVSAMGGKTEVWSSAEAGTTFRASFPR
jgi:hypothetical protein